jgi:transcriptional regulator GlxA family with amidase domain
VSYLNSFFASPESVKNLKGIFTVCTGSFLLGRSRLPNRNGTLDGVRATTNKRGFLRAKDEMPKVLWEPKARWVRTELPLPIAGEGDVHKVKLLTTSGVSAGTDGIFALIAEEYGSAVADFIAAILEYERKTDPNDDPFAVQL